MGAAPRAAAASEFLAPLPLAAVALMAVNDHFLKPAFHNAVTGKLSDVAICFFLPLYLSALLGLAWRPRWPPARLLLGAALAAGVFVTLELSDAAGRWFLGALRWLSPALRLGPVGLTRDPTDLLALLLVPAAVWYGWRRLALAGPR